MPIRWLQSEIESEGERRYQYLAAKGNYLLIVTTLGNDPMCKSVYEVHDCVDRGANTRIRECGTKWTAKEAQQEAEQIVNGLEYWGKR